MKQIKNAHIEEIGLHEGLQRELSIYPQKIMKMVLLQLNKYTIPIS